MRSSIFALSFAFALITISLVTSSRIFNIHALQLTTTPQLPTDPFVSTLTTSSSSLVQLNSDIASLPDPLIEAQQPLDERIQQITNLTNEPDDDDDDDKDEHGTLFAFIVLMVVVGLFVLVIIYIVISAQCRRARQRREQELLNNGTDVTLASEHHNSSLQSEYIQLQDNQQTNQQSLKIALEEQKGFNTSNSNNSNIAQEEHPQSKSSLSQSSKETSPSLHPSKDKLSKSQDESSRLLL